MKSSFLVLGSVTLLCLGVVRCSRDFLDNDENFLDKKRNEDEERTLKDENTEWALYKARRNWNELTNEINELSSLQRSDDPAKQTCEDITCYNGGECDEKSGNAKCVCTGGYEGDHCELMPKSDCEKEIKECADTNGNCKKVDASGKSECVCPTGNKFVESKGCLTPQCVALNCHNGGKCIEEGGNAKCDCTGGYEGDHCEILPKSKCEKEIKECADTNGNCKKVDDSEKIDCECSGENTFVESKGCLSPQCVALNCYNGGKCIEESGNAKCDCTGGYDGDHCEILPKSKCEKEIKECADTNGNCKKVDASEKIDCECSGENTFVESKGCLSPQCVAFNCYNGGKCIEESGNAKCDCTGGYDGDHCEILPTALCEEKLKVCADTNGTCKTADDQGKIECVCSQENKFVEGKGCLSPAQMRCLNFTCYNGGTCNGQKDNAECTCVGGYTGDNCEIFPKSECLKNNKTCAETDGQCKSTAQGVICECPEGTSYLSSDGCKNRCENFDCYNGGECQQGNGVPNCRCINGFTGKKCEKFPKEKCKIEKCDETGGTCMSEDKDKVNCTCKKGSVFVNDKGCQKIEDINCKEICGLNSEVKCGGNKKIKEEIECSCTNNTKEFDKGAKECKISYCKIKCGAVQCLGNKFDENDVKCNCSKPYEDFDEEKRKCKTDYCKKNCGTAECDAEDKYIDSNIKCSCDDTDYVFVEKDKKCIQKCSENTLCENEGTCEGKEGEKVCSCKNGTIGDLCKTIEACEEGGKYGKCRNDKGNCKFEGGKAICECSEEVHVLYEDGGYCDVQCTNDTSCEGNRKCNKDKFCVCKKGWEGDDCDVVTGCKTLDKECEDIGKECVFDATVPGLLATCKCGENLKYYRDKKQCLPQCGTNKTCGDRRICNNDNFCECKTGYEGDDCSIVTGCKKLRKKCKEIGVDCIFDDKSSVKATCNCKKGFKYDPKDNQCKHEFCYPHNPCKKPANCTFDESTEVGFCKCAENQFYSYEAEKCKEFDDKCLLKKTSCGKNEVCNKKTGKCECKGKIEGEECKWNFCDTKPCFTGANCTENERCFCAEGKYYKNKACKAADCNIKNYKTSCKCPAGKREKEDGECVIEAKEKCENMTEADCGYGICKKVSNKDSCKCFTFAENNKALKGKCTLKKELCASGKLQENDPMKCKCEGIYKQADDGITCTLRTCDDDDVTEKCESLGGKCVMRWKGDGYDCECPEGYDKDNNGKCSDPCSVEKNFKECTKKGQVCYNSFSATNKITTSCNCPPTVKLVNGKCEEKAENAYLFKNIPVLKEKYELKSGINKVLLNKHLVQSLQQTFKKDLYEFGYLFDYNVQGDIVKCSVWVNFRKAPTDKDLKKIKAASKTFSKVCDDCDDSVMIWPPNLFLSSTGLKKVESDKQDFCKVKDRLCGKGAKCTQDENNGKCTCDEGYQVVQYGILKIGPYEVQVCEDINECALGTHKCPTNTECFNTIGNYSCVCKEGFKKEKPPVDPETDKSGCVDLCTPSPCKKGKCVINEKEKTFDCECEPGVAGSYCQRADEHYKSAKKSTVVVGAVLGTILIVGAIAVIYFIIKKKKRFGSEDFMPAPRMDHAEMTERRHIRGVTNKAYE